MSEPADPTAGGPVPPLARSAPGASAAAPEAGDAQAYVALAAACAATGEAETALAHFAQALVLDPHHLAARLNRAVLLLERGRATDALQEVETALAHAPDCVAAHRWRGRTLDALGRQREALAAYRTLLAHAPLDADAEQACATLHRALGEPEAALAAVERGLARSPTQAPLHEQRGVLLLELRRPAEALECFAQASALDPALASPHLNAAIAWAVLGHATHALAACDRAIELAPGLAVAHRNRGRLLFDGGRPEAALASYDAALALDPDSAEAHLCRGTALRSLGRLEDACAALGTALTLAPTHALARFSLADCCLHLGRYAEGWSHYEARLQLASAVRRSPLQGARYTGAQALANRVVFVWWEQAIGDTIQFARYLPLLEARGARVVFSLPRPLHALLSTVSPTVTLLGEAEAPAHYDLEVPLLSLPRAFASDERTLPAAVPYLSASPARVREWQQRLGTQGLKVGIAWAGAQRPGGHGRAFELAQLAPLAAVPGVRLISLQRGGGLDELAALPGTMQVERPPGAFDEGDDALLDTAAIICGLDLVISCDTSIAHLAGALGRPTWLALKFMPDWRWGPRAPDTAWYPTMRLYRQPRRWQWAPVFAAMARDLRALAGGHAP